jgi:hypothetical protein
LGTSPVPAILKVKQPASVWRHFMLCEGKFFPPRLTVHGAGVIWRTDSDEKNAGNVTIRKDENIVDVLQPDQKSTKIDVLQTD